MSYPKPDTIQKLLKKYNISLEIRYLHRRKSIITKNQEREMSFLNRYLSPFLNSEFFNIVERINKLNK